MFPLSYNSRLPYCILVPPYDPLIEYYTNGSGAPSSGRTEYRFDRGGSQHRVDFRNGVLEVVVPAPLRPEPKTRRVEVKETK